MLLHKVTVVSFVMLRHYSLSDFVGDICVASTMNKPSREKLLPQICMKRTNETICQNITFKTFCSKAENIEINLH